MKKYVKIFRKKNGKLTTLFVDIGIEFSGWSLNRRRPGEGYFSCIEIDTDYPIDTLANLIREQFEISTTGVSRMYDKFFFAEIRAYNIQKRRYPYFCKSPNYQTVDLTKVNDFSRLVYSITLFDSNVHSCSSFKIVELFPFTNENILKYLKEISR